MHAICHVNVFILVNSYMATTLCIVGSKTVVLLGRNKCAVLFATVRSNRPGTSFLMRPLPATVTQIIIPKQDLFYLNALYVFLT